MPAHYRHLRPYRQFSFATDNFVVVVRSAEAMTSAEVNQRNDHAISVPRLSNSTSRAVLTHGPAPQY